MTQESLPFDSTPALPVKKTFWSAEALKKLDAAVNDKASPEAHQLQVSLKRRAERTKRLLEEITETERLTAEDYSIRMNTVE